MNHLDGAIQKVTALFLAAGAILYFGVNAYVYGTTAGIMNEHHEAQNPRDPWMTRNITIVDHRNPGGRGFKPGYLEMTKGDDIRANRFVSITAYVRLDELLAEGEKPPQKSMEEVFAKSRAVIFAREECARLLETLARECVVAGADGRVDGGLVRMNAMFRFIQRDSFGALAESETYVFTTADSVIARNASVYQSGAAAARAALYKKTAAECDAIRRRDGSCAITRLTVTAQRQDGGVIRHTAMAGYAFLLKARA